MKQYLKRIADEWVKEHLRIFGAVLIEGPKWSGKTWTARNAAASEFDIADPKGNFRNREIARINPQAVLEMKRPRLIDEWQEAPHLWDAVRYEVDRKGEKGAFILTGSSTPDDTARIHSGAGRFGRIRIRTMSMQEMGVSTGNISIAKLFSKKLFTSGKYRGELSIGNVAQIICKGGWPALLRNTVAESQRVLDSYLKTAAEVDITKIDKVKRDPVKMTALIKSIARNTATMAKKSTIAKDIAEFSSLNISDDTIGEYMTLLERMFLIDTVPAWTPPLKSTVRLRTTPKRMLADVSLAASAMGADPVMLRSEPKTLGMFFEALVLHDLAIYGEAIGAELYFYLDNSGLEVDAVLVKKNGEWGAFEIKLGYHQEDEAAESLLRLKKKLAGTKQKPPAFMGVITGIGSFAKKRSDGVLVIPVDHLGI